MKKISLIILLICFYACAKKDVQIEKGFTKINLKKGESIKSLSNKIIPNKKYSYWEFVTIRFPGTQKREEIRRKKIGDSNNLSRFKFEKQKKGFFKMSGLGYEYSYIICVDGDIVKYVTNEKDLIGFIGGIDNIEEALIISNVRNNLWVDYDDIRGGAFKKVDDGYELYLARFEDCPVKTTSFKVKVDTEGNTQVVKNGVYYESEDCIMI